MVTKSSFSLIDGGDEARQDQTEKLSFVHIHVCLQAGFCANEI